MKNIKYFLKKGIIIDIKKKEKMINYINIFFIIKNLILLIIILFLFRLLKNNKIYQLKNEIKLYKKYIKSCRKIKIFQNETIINKNPYLSIIIPVYNMEKYIERALLSVINQSFQDFEIIIINDYSNDNTKYIINKFIFLVNKIKIIEHKENLGIYASRIDGALSANGKYILYVDPDDAILNQNLFQRIYDFNINYSLDIIEFIVLYEEEGKNTIYIPEEHTLNHFHNFTQKIIYQPELSNLLFFKPREKNYSDIICRCVWNKIIKKQILLKTINFLGKYIYKNQYFNFAEDTIINIINFQYANNYTNIDIPGYLYNIREKSISHGNLGKNHDIMISSNFFLYLKLLYKYILYFNKDRNYLFYEIQQNIIYLIRLNYFNISKDIINLRSFIGEILNDNKISEEFQMLLFNITNNINN